MKINMPAHKLILDDVFEQPFKLIAIHSSVEEYRLAYLFNKHLDLRLARTSKDLDFHSGKLSILFAHYTFEDKQKDCFYHLVSNIARGETISPLYANSLFEGEQPAYHKAYLLPDYKQVDYFLKIEDETDVVSEKFLLEKIKEIPQVSTAYAIDFHQIKSKENLIFE